MKHVKIVGEQAVEIKHLRGALEEADALETELDSGLMRLALVLTGGKEPDDAAWWLCANHAPFIIDQPNLGVEAKLIEMATRAGAPPTGKDWPSWFDRVRSLKSCPWKQGYAAWNAGKLPLLNAGPHGASPYTAGSDEDQDWVAGWLEAECDNGQFGVGA